VLVLIVSIVLHKSSPLYSLDFIVLTLNQVCGFKFYRITYSPPYRCSHKGTGKGGDWSLLCRVLVQQTLDKGGFFVECLLHSRQRDW
jgi:hypothetical protein